MVGDAVRADGGDGNVATVRLRQPTVADGGQMWRIARDSRVLDVNSSYSYLLWCREFSATSVVAREGDGLVGFATGFIRPAAPDTLMVWQIAVDGAARGRGLAGRMLDDLFDRVTRHGVRYLETTITPGNEASSRLFLRFAHHRGLPVERRVLLPEGVFPDEHEREDLYRIGPAPLSP